MYLKNLSRVCPTTQGTRAKHHDRFIPPGITVVTFVRERSKFRSVFDKLTDLRASFVPYNFRIHFTLQAICHKTSRLSTDQRQHLLNTTGRVVRELAAEHKPFRGKLHGVRPGPGSFGEIVTCGDGTVVFAAAQETEEFLCNLGDKIRTRLRGAFPGIAPILKELERIEPRSGGWVTLGFFDEDDFDVDEGFRNFFRELCDEVLEFDIDRISIVEFGHRSLNDSH